MKVKKFFRASRGLIGTTRLCRRQCINLPLINRFIPPCTLCAPSLQYSWIRPWKVPATSKVAAKKLEWLICSWKVVSIIFCLKQDFFCRDPIDSPKKSPQKSPKKSAKKTAKRGLPKKVRGSEKYKSAEFVESSSEDETSGVKSLPKKKGEISLVTLQSVVSLINHSFVPRPFPLFLYSHQLFMHSTNCDCLD